ncbi:MAG: LuxR C-terminal-related transcriptional regulator [Muribaculaceae bacterium]|nr:LuxR C-terminal-related transcriptional regulator [Muribaculaceae bacterium]
MNSYIRSRLTYIYILLLFSLFSLSSELSAQGFAPVRNFSPAAYNSGTQNWDMAQDSFGRIYIANRDGLLRFNGAKWSRVRLPNYTSVRSLYIDEKNNRVYVGGSGEFGFFDLSLSKSSYTSLVPTLTEADRNFSEIWNIFTDNNGNIWFQGDFNIYRYDGRHTLVMPAGGKVTASAVSSDLSTPFFALESGDIFKITGSKVSPLLPSQPLHGIKIVSLLVPQNNSDPFLIATAFNGLYILEGNSFVPFLSPINDFLKENQLFCAAHNEDDYAFGTVNCGAVLTNFLSGKSSFINRRTGLQNNTVLNLGFDFNNSLWLCLDNGVSIALTDFPVGNLLGSDNESGAGYASMLLDNNILLGTNQALFSIPNPTFNTPLPPSPVKIMNGQIWTLDTIGSTLFIGADTGLFTSPKNSTVIARKIEGIPGTWQVKPLKAHPGYALASTYDHFHLLKYENGIWINLGKVGGYSDAGGKFVEDKNGNIWIAHWLKGIFKLKLNVEARKFTYCTLINSAKGLPSDRNNSVTLVNDRIVIIGDGGLYRIGTDGRAVRDNELSSVIPLFSSSHLYPLPNGSLFAISPRLAWMAGRTGDGNFSLDSISFKSVAKKIIPGFEHVGIVGKNLVVSNEDGFLLLNPEKKINNSWKSKVMVDAIYANQDSLIYRAEIPDGKEKQNLSIPFFLNSIRFEFALPEFRDENGALYSCKLENYDDDWSSFSDAASREYTRLHEGDYTLQLKALNPVTGEISYASFPFSILPPWYRSVWAKLVYLILSILFIIFAYRLIKVASLKAARKIEIRKEEEIHRMKEAADKEALRKDYEIAALKSDQLEHDIKHKSSELSNITMNVIRKNEILTDISTRLSRLLQAAKNRGESTTGILDKDINKIQSIIRENISHDDDWKNFNQNFDIVYENYTKRLNELHPDLTKTELRICCYIKMGLSSKEIAPLFNVTPRSVEMGRYRMRKKMNLSRDINLTSYLQSL